LEEASLPRTQELDIINWWKVSGSRYPTLQKLARDILHILVTSVASECAFSTSGRVLSAHRSRLAPNVAEALMCMQAWSRADLLGNLFCTLVSLLSNSLPFTY
jgi:inhibitor of KinA sporulation pathway (predicted exonuclease)